MLTDHQDSVRDLFRRLVAIEPLPVPEGEVGVTLNDWPPADIDALQATGGASGGPARQTKYVPILSVYLDLRISGPRPGERPSRVVLRERLHQIEITFAPRGAAFDAVQAGASRIERYLDTEVSPSSKGIALFVSEPHRLFETLITDISVETQVSAGAVPDLFQLARALADQEVAVVAVVEVDAARLFIVHHGGMRELRRMADDPKYYHMVRGVNAMNQAHYQRHALNKRERFAAEVAQQLEKLVAREQAKELILVGEVEAIPLIREALSPSLVKLVREVPRSLGSTEMSTPADLILEDIKPLLDQARAEKDRSIVERLIEAVQSDRLGVAGLEPTRRALSYGQVETLILPANELSGSLAMPVQTRNELLELAARTDAAIAIVEDENEAFTRLGGVGALLRYRLTEMQS
jgi:stalled ribosome rescue protein Dom34